MTARLCHSSNNYTEAVMRLFWGPIVLSSNDIFTLSLTAPQRSLTHSLSVGCRRWRFIVLFMHSLLHLINSHLLIKVFPRVPFWFTVLQDCATDSEELIYPMRAPSSCSAPPDLLLTGDREPIMGSRITPTTNNTQQKDSSKMSSQPKAVDGISTERMLLEVSFLKVDFNHEMAKSHFWPISNNNNKWTAMRFRFPSDCLEAIQFRCFVYCDRLLVCIPLSRNKKRAGNSIHLMAVGCACAPSTATRDLRYFNCFLVIGCCAEIQRNDGTTNKNEQKTGECSGLQYEMTFCGNELKETKRI